MGTYYMTIVKKNTIEYSSLFVKSTFIGELVIVIITPVKWLTSIASSLSMYEMYVLNGEYFRGTVARERKKNTVINYYEFS